MKIDCFAYNDGDCRALERNFINCENCVFYKTKEQNEKEIERCKRINEMKGIDTYA